MNNLVAAAQQALEALEAFLSDDLSPYDAAKIITALRTALTQHQADAVVWECKAGGLKRLTQRQYEMQSDKIKRHYTRICGETCERAKLCATCARELT